MTTEAYNPQCQDRVAGLLFSLRRNPSLFGFSSGAVLAIVQGRTRTTEDLCYMAKEIQLTKGKVALVDDSDYEWLSRQRWLVVDGRRCYARSFFKSRRGVYMHRLILGVEHQPSIQVDHKDGNSLNNQRSNLRLATQSQNQQNRGLSANNTSGFKGVQRRVHRYNDGRELERWHAHFKHNNKQIWVGTFNNAIDAAKAYDQRAREVFGEFAYLNFPPEGESVDV